MRTVIEQELQWIQQNRSKQTEMQWFQSFYIGQTGRLFTSRYNEHKSHKTTIQKFKLCIEHI